MVFSAHEKPPICFRPAEVRSDYRVVSKDDGGFDALLLKVRAAANFTDTERDDLVRALEWCVRGPKV